jgi:hypothetical protein
LLQNVTKGLGLGQILWIKDPSKEKWNTLYSSPSIIRMTKSRRMRWAGHVERRGRRVMHIGYWWESQKERDD